MKVLGWKIREARKQKRLSQAALAEGICTQATISKIENKNSCDSLDIFSSLCGKLEVSVFDCLEETYEQELERVLENIEALCEQMKHKEACKILRNYTLDIGKVSSLIQTKFYYYKGSTSLITKFNCEEARVDLSKAAKIEKQPTIYNILSLNAIAISYQLQDDYKQAKLYNERAYKMIAQFSKSDLPKVSCRFFYNLAKYYSELKDYKKSIELCNQGIELSKEKNFTFGVDVLLYEKAYNEYYLNGSTEGYKIAYYFTRFMGHQYMFGCVKRDMERYQIQP